MRLFYSNTSYWVKKKSIKPVFDFNLLPFKFEPNTINVWIQIWGLKSQTSFYKVVKKKKKTAS